MSETLTVCFAGEDMSIMIPMRYFIAVVHKSTELSIWKDRVMNILIGYANSLSRNFAQNHLASNDTTMNIVTCGTVRECLEIVDENLNLDMIELDMEMPDMNGLAGFERVRDACVHPLPIALIGPAVKRRDIRDILSARVAGYVTYSMTLDTILNAIKLIAAGEVFVPADMMANDTFQSNSQFLTGREHDVLSGLLAGSSNKEIARNLNLSEVMIKHHLKSLRSKLGAQPHTCCM
jgi:two-component system, NarL family, nitrate/nitrite response regulator NarL